MGKPNDLVQGMLDLLILKTIALEPKHGWAIAKRIQQISNEVGLPDCQTNRDVTKFRSVLTYASAKTMVAS